MHARKHSCNGGAIKFAIALTNESSNQGCHLNGYAKTTLYVKFTSLATVQLFVGPGDYSRLGASLA